MIVPINATDPATSRVIAAAVPECGGH